MTTNDTNDTVITPAESTPDAITPTTVPASTPAKRARRATVPAVIGPVPTPSMYAKSGIDGIVAVARTVTAANFSAVVARYTVNHGVSHAGRNVGRASNDRIVAFQNRIMLRNAEWQLDDVQIAAMVRIEFPVAVGKLFTGTPADGVSIVRGIRAEYNRPGHHGATFAVTTDALSYGAKKIVFPDPTK